MFWTSLATTITYQYEIVARTNEEEGRGGSGEVIHAIGKEVTTLARSGLRLLLKLKNEEEDQQ